MPYHSTAVVTAKAAPNDPPFKMLLRSYPEQSIGPGKSLGTNLPTIAPSFRGVGGHLAAAQAENKNNFIGGPPAVEL